MALILSLESTATILPQSPGNSGTVDVRFPVPEYYQQYATQDGNPVPTTGRLFLLLPPNFDSRRVWPILIVTATKDPGHTAPSDAPWYHAAAAAEGWIVLATDATVRPRNDSVAGDSRFSRPGWTSCITNGQSRPNGRWRLLASRAVRSAPNGLELS